jgi:hypothetical protein
MMQRQYPQTSFEEEKRIGQMVAAMTNDTEPIVVLGNPVFYHWAGREPASRIFHLPAYLPGSQLWPEVEAELVAAMSNSETGAVLVSRKQFKKRLSDVLKDTLEERWLPAGLLSYEYQDDVYLYLPEPTLPILDDEPLATFSARMALLTAETRWLSEQNLEVSLWWSADKSPGKDWTVFVHLLDPTGRLVAQHDGMPVSGLRPTSTWGPGEVITDIHLLTLPAGESIGEAHLAIGLYDLDTGQRSQLLDKPGETVSFTLDIDEEVP